jgi:hypothetical protein
MVSAGKHCYIFVLLMQTEPLATIDCLGAAASPPPKGPMDHHHDVASPWGEEAPSDQENQASLDLQSAGALRQARECRQDWCVINALALTLTSPQPSPSAYAHLLFSALPRDDVLVFDVD